jgi:hypothetical protein
MRKQFLIMAVILTGLVDYAGAQWIQKTAGLTNPDVISLLAPGGLLFAGASGQGA